MSGQLVHPVDPPAHDVDLPSTRVRPRWPRWVFRIAATVATVMLFDQGIFAGQFLSGVYPALEVHRANATFAGIAVLVAALAAGLQFRPGGGPWWPIAGYLLLFGLVVMQIMLGFARALALHVPLGVAIILIATALAVWGWMRRWPR